MSKTTSVTGRILYSILFLLIIPIALWFWAKYTERLIPFPKIESRIGGWILFISGGILMFWGMFALKKYGSGLPMNAYPPSQFVNRGPYRLLRHPIYWGFGILMIGCFLFTGLPSGLWLVTPVTILGMIALVWGYEKIDLKQRFPERTIITVLDLPEKNTEHGRLRDRFASLFWVGALLLLGNFLTVKWTGITPALFGKPLSLHHGFENPYLPILTILFIAAIPFLLKRKDMLREWALSVIIALSFSLFLSLLFPALGAQYLPPTDLLLKTESGLAISLISVPVFLIFISLQAIFKQSRSLAVLFSFGTLALGIIQLTNSRSAVLHFTVSVMVFIVAVNYNRIWIFLKNASQKMPIPGKNGSSAR